MNVIYRKLDEKLWARAPNKVMKSKAPNACGRALLSYLNRPVMWKENDPRLGGHSNRWECREIAMLLKSFGYSVDSIFFTNTAFQPKGQYDIFLDIHGNMQRLAPLMPTTLKLLHITGSYPRFQNAAEEKRAREFEERTSLPYRPKRTIKDLDEFDRSLEAADRCSLIGNAITMSTFPERFRDKITLVRVSGSRSYIKPSKMLPHGNEFVWFFGTGAVHKGLDRVLDAFARLPELRLNVIGGVDHEADFMAAYGKRLSSPNVRYHGPLNPESTVFKEIMDRSIAFIAPSCSESISSAAATVMRVGLYPIVSRETGITLPDGHGTYLDSSTVEEILQACSNVSEMPRDQLTKHIAACQSFALSEYSREAFSRDMRAYLSDSIDMLADRS